MSYQILTGQFKVGPVTASIDVSEEISQVLITISRAAVNVPHRGNGAGAYDIAGPKSMSMAVEYISSAAGASLTAGNLFHTEVFKAVDAGTTLKFWHLTYVDFPVSEYNKITTFEFAPLEASYGGTEGDIGRNSGTFSIIPSTFDQADDE